MLRPPRTEAEWTAYFALRWQVLREPWGQAPGSERDEDEATALHRAVWEAGRPLAIGRLQAREPGCGQIRYMAVVPAVRGRGLGRQVLDGLEELARERAWRQIHLNARVAVVGFYAAAGYVDDGPGPVLFDRIAHRRMVKTLAAAD